MTQRTLFFLCAGVLSSGWLVAEETQWLSVPEAPVSTEVIKDGARAADGTSWFAASYRNAGEIKRAVWTVSGLGVFDVYANGVRVGEDFLKPGFTHYAKTKYSFAYDVTSLMKTAADAENRLAAEVSAGWWRDKIVTPAGRKGFVGQKSAFRGELEVTYADGTKRVFRTNASDWKCGISGPVTHAAIFDGEEYDARVKAPCFGEGLESVPEINEEFKGEVLPSVGAEVCLRRDLAICRGPFALKKGETLVVDFGQNCAAVPEFTFSAKAGAVLTALPGEMLNDSDKGQRGCDGPKGSVYRENLRVPDSGMRLVYTFAGTGKETYHPRFTFFGYRYLSITATEDVAIESVDSIPVTSIKKELELGSLEVGDPSLNRFIKNVYWGQLSNYLSVPTDCPQRNERLGWSADTQVFCEAGTYNADTTRFFRKFTRDLRDSRCGNGGYPSVAPTAQYGNETFNLGWADVGVIVPWTVWKQFGDLEILAENWDAMSTFVRKLDETKYDFEGRLGYIYADWLSYEKFETCGNSQGSWHQWKNNPDAQNYRRFLAACYWLYDARLMVEMGTALGRPADEVAWFKASTDRALAHIRGKFLESDGLLLKPMRDLQTACVFALKFGVVEGAARGATKAILLKSIRDHGDCLQTGFLGTSFLMEVLAQENEFDTAYTLLFQHKNPSWLYSVDQGATTVWERWNSYTKKDGFGPVGMNSFNHYAYGAVLAWVYRHAAGIACDSSSPGFKTIVMAPKPDRRLGYVKASYKSAAGLIVSSWRYEGDTWIWNFTVPEGATARVTLPDSGEVKDYSSGSYEIRRAAAPEVVSRPVGRVVHGQPVVVDFGPQGEGGYPAAVVSAVSGSGVKLRLSYATHPAGAGETGDFCHATRATYLGEDFDLPIAPASTDRFDVFPVMGAGTVRAAKSQGLVRYVRVAVDTPNATVDVARVFLENRGVHSTEPVVGSFECSDPELTRIWQASVRTCQLAAIPSYEMKHVKTLPYLSDGAKRDRLVWSGDLWWAQRNMYAAFAPDSPYLPGSLDMLAENQTPAGYINACPYPQSRGPITSEVYGPFGSDEFAAWFVPVLADHYLYTGDKALLERRYPNVVKVMDYLAQYQEADGLFTQRPETAKHSEGLAVGGTSLHHRTYMHLLLWKSYVDAAQMATWLGKREDAARFTASAERLATLLKTRFFRPHLKRFGLSLEDPDAHAFVANAAALAFGFLKGEEAKDVLTQLVRDDHGKFQMMAIRGAFELKDGAKALALLNAHNWRAVVQDDWQGTHLVTECMTLKYAGWGDEAHPDTALAGVFTDYILGVRPTSPGYATYVIDPIPVPGITWAKGTVPTPRGPLTVEWRLVDGKIESASHWGL